MLVLSIYFEIIFNRVILREILRHTESICLSQLRLISIITPRGLKNNCTHLCKTNRDKIKLYTFYIIFFLYFTNILSTTAGLTREELEAVDC